MQGLCGSGNITEDQVRNIIPPMPTETWHPISHGDFLDVVDNSLKNHGLSVVNKEFQTTHEDNRLFGVYDLNGDTSKDDFGFSLAVRNSTDKCFSAGLAGGTRVFVCSNLMFEGEIVVNRKHTRWILNDLPKKMDNIILNLVNQYRDTCNQIEYWKQEKVSEQEAKAFMWDIANRQILPFNFVKKQIYSVWEKPLHDSHKGNSVWTLHNSISESLKIRRVKNPHAFAWQSEMISGMIKEKWSIAA